MTRPPLPTITPDHSPAAQLQDSCHIRLIEALENQTQIDSIYLDCKDAKWYRVPGLSHSGGGSFTYNIPNSEVWALEKTLHEYQTTVFLVIIHKQHHEHLTGAMQKLQSSSVVFQDYDHYLVLGQDVDIHYDPGYEPTPAPTYEPRPTATPRHGHSDYYYSLGCRAYRALGGANYGNPNYDPGCE